MPRYNIWCFSKGSVTSSIALVVTRTFLFCISSHLVYVYVLRKMQTASCSGKNAGITIMELVSLIRRSPIISEIRGRPSFEDSSQWWPSTYFLVEWRFLCLYICEGAWLSSFAFLGRFQWHFSELGIAAGASMGPASLNNILVCVFTGCAVSKGIMFFVGEHFAIAGVPHHCRHLATSWSPWRSTDSSA